MVMPQITIDLMEAYKILGPLALIIGGITVYGVLVFNFYRFLARKDIITLNLQKHNQAKRPALRKTISVVFYIFKFLMLYPVFVFFWFCVMAGLLYVLGKNQTTETVMLVAMGVVGSIRVSSYYREALSTDIAKILPFALLGVMIIDSSIIRIVESTEGVREAALEWETAIYYLVAVVALEFVLRMTAGIIGLIIGRRKSRDLEESQETAQSEPTGAPSYTGDPEYRDRVTSSRSGRNRSGARPEWADGNPTKDQTGLNGRQELVAALCEGHQGARPRLFGGDAAD